MGITNYDYPTKEGNWVDFYTEPENARRFLSGLKSFLQPFLHLEIKKGTNLILEFSGEEMAYTVATMISSLLSQNTLQSIYSVYRQNTNSW